MSRAKHAALACARALAERQLPEGGWPFSVNAKQMAVESTALALLALLPSVGSECHAAARCLLGAQNPDGSWPAFGGDDEQGSGYTGLAVFALSWYGGQEGPIDRAVRWLLRFRGCESHWLWKWKFRIADRHARFDPGKFGWPWMPETVSWVFPTAYSLLGLDCVRLVSQRRLRDFRIFRGAEMLHDRVCSEGGWNAGNRVVYGAALTPHADTTAVALLALLREPPNDDMTSSLDSLERRAPELLVPWSLAWSILALHAAERPVQTLIGRLCDVAEPARIHDCATLAVVCLALRCSSGANLFRAKP